MLFKSLYLSAALAAALCVSDNAYSDTPAPRYALVRICNQGASCPRDREITGAMPSETPMSEADCNAKGKAMADDTHTFACIVVPTSHPAYPRPTGSTNSNQ